MTDKNPQDDVAKKIESGQYFAEAMSWFHVKFTRPRTEASYLFVIFLIAFAAFCIGMAAFSRIFPLSPGTNFVLAYPITPESRIKIQSIQRPGETVDASVIKYILSQYVRAREEYIEKNINDDQKFVIANSDEAVANQYLSEIDLNNPDNPIVKYGNQATREVTLGSIKLMDNFGRTANDNTVAKASVYYTNTITFLSDNTRESTNYVADITFHYQQIIVDQKTGELTQKPALTVTGYTTRILEN